MNFITATDLPAQDQSTNSYYKAIIYEIMNYITNYVEEKTITEDEADDLEFYYDTFVIKKQPCFTTLVMNIIYKHHLKCSHMHPSMSSTRSNQYSGMNDDLYYIKSVTCPFYMYQHLSKSIVKLCYAFERLYGKRQERIIRILTFMEQIEDKVSPNLNQVIVNKDLGRYLMGFIN
jgi:hypothetical protein